MVSVRINGQDSGINTAKLSKVTDLIELIKASIDPDHMITGITTDGRDLGEQEWSATINQLGTTVIEVETDTPERYVSDRFSKAADIVRTCYMEFRDSRKAFQNGEMLDGNQKLVKAVNTARAFFEWYMTMLQLVPPDKKARYDISAQVEEISSICKRICQQQLYQSWWALGETLEKELEPKLDKLEDFCRGFNKQV